MALSQRLDLRQSQALVMTPQLQQAIKLLQLSNLELSAFIETELEENPLLERDDTPVDGAVVGLTPYVLNGRTYGERIEIQPSDAPSLVVSLTNLRIDPSLSVGSTVASATSKLGTVLQLSGVERQALARVTQDAGDHVAVTVHTSATLATP